MPGQKASAKPPIDPTTFGGRLQAAMKAAGYKQRSLADQVGVTEVAIFHYINGTTKFPRGDILLKLAACLETTPEYLLYGIGPRSHVSSVALRKKLLKEWLRVIADTCPACRGKHYPMKGRHHDHTT